MTISHTDLHRTLADYTSGEGNIGDLQAGAEACAGPLADRVLGALTEYENSAEDEGALRARLSPLVREYAKRRARAPFGRAYRSGCTQTRAQEAAGWRYTRGWVSSSASRASSWTSSRRSLKMKRVARPKPAPTR